MGRLSLSIPAFSLAILSIVLPRYSVWSNPILVIIQSFFLSIMLVASNLPPNPVSIILISLGFLWNAINAAAVVISKKVIGLFLCIVLGLGGHES